MLYINTIVKFCADAFNNLYFSSWPGVGSGNMTECWTMAAKGCGGVGQNNEGGIKKT